MQRETENLVIEQKERLIKERNCPVCGARRDQNYRMMSFERSIIDFLFEHNIDGVTADSCILCVEKHVGTALVLHQELMTAKNSGNKDGVAHVNIYRNHLEIIGNLTEAAKESYKWVDLHELLLHSEREYRYYGVAPDWAEIMELLQKVKSEGVKK